MTFAHQIGTAEFAVEQLKAAYLRRWGWKETCQTPGSYWLWSRDFADYDAKFDAWHAKFPDRPRRPATGVLTLPLDLAVSMTIRALDEQPELAEDDAADTDEAQS